MIVIVNIAFVMGIIIFKYQAEDMIFISVPNFIIGFMSNQELVFYDVTCHVTSD